MAEATYLLYADDSGDEAESFYSALLVPVPLWPVYLGKWLRYRQWLYKQHRVPSRYELHAYEWIPAKGLPPVPDDPRAAINTSVNLRRETALKALRTVTSMKELGLVTCRHDGAVKDAAYRTMLATVDAELAARDAWAIVVTDGDPKNPDPHVQRAHRDLDIKTRRIVEDGWVQPAHASQLVQMADLIVHCAFQSHRRPESREFMWNWYPEHLHQLEWVCGCP